jgi:hypothetical protein
MPLFFDMTVMVIASVLGAIFPSVTAQEPFTSAVAVKGPLPLIVVVTVTVSPAVVELASP